MTLATYRCPACGRTFRFPPGYVWTCVLCPCPMEPVDVDAEEDADHAA